MLLLDGLSEPSDCDGELLRCSRPTLLLALLLPVRLLPLLLLLVSALHLPTLSAVAAAAAATAKLANCCVVSTLSGCELWV